MRERENGDLVEVEEVAYRCIATPIRLGARRVGRRLRFDLAEMERMLEPHRVAAVRSDQSTVLPPGVRLLRGQMQRS
jgi:hypothetical protein